MDAKVFLSSLIVALFILIPLAVKWKIDLKYAFIGIFLFSGITAAVLSLNFIRNIFGFPWIFAVEAVLIVLLIVTTMGFSFYRDPERIPPQGKNIIVSPADSKVLYVKEIRKGEIPFSKKKGRKHKLEELTKTGFLSNGEAYQIGILMTYLDVHVVRAPINGHIRLIKQVPGKFISLKKEEAILVNERVTTIIENNELRIAVVQIASRLVRRILPYVKIGQEVKIGERIGIIKFGSQVDLVIPKGHGIRIYVKPGDKVKAGVSIIAVYNEKNNQDI